LFWLRELLLQVEIYVSGLDNATEISISAVPKKENTLADMRVMQIV